MLPICIESAEEGPVSRLQICTQQLHSQNELWLALLKAKGKRRTLGPVTALSIFVMP